MREHGVCELVYLGERNGLPPERLPRDRRGLDARAHREEARPHVGTFIGSASPPGALGAYTAVGHTSTV
jgi:hypothetical protein